MSDLVWVIAYLALQVGVIAWARGSTMRIVAGLPLLVMIPVYAFTLYLYQQQSNLWGLLMGIGTPIALLYVIVMAVVIGVSNRRAKRV
jgi:hypothetical protein